ncbi:MAG: glycosyltransferase family 4 protein, partial [Pseudomonadota bacterium]
MLTYDFRSSGVVKNALRIGRALSDAGTAVEHWVCRAEGDLAPEAACARVSSARSGTTRAPRDLDSLASIPALSRMIRRVRPKVLLSAGNQMHVHAALALRMTPRAARPRFVGRASNAIVAQSDRSPILSRLAGRAERFQFRAMDRVLAVSEELSDALSTLVGVDPAQVSFIPNGIDVDRVRA